MPATAAPSAAPATAHYIWADGRNIYLQLRYSNGDPYILPFPRNSLGLSKLIAIIAPPMDKSEPQLLHRPAPRPTNPVASEILRKLGVI